MSTFADLMLAQPCTFCLAAPGMPCRRKPSGIVTRFHSARFYAVYTAKAVEVRGEVSGDE